MDPSLRSIIIFIAVVVKLCTAERKFIFCLNTLHTSSAVLIIQVWLPLFRDNSFSQPRNCTRSVRKVSDRIFLCEHLMDYNLARLHEPTLNLSAHA